MVVGKEGLLCRLFIPLLLDTARHARPGLFSERERDGLVLSEPVMKSLSDWKEPFSNVFGIDTLAGPAATRDGRDENGLS